MDSFCSGWVERSKKPSPSPAVLRAAAIITIITTAQNKSICQLGAPLSKQASKQASKTLHH
eukprot:scaffold382_cov154-Amphora_coffeaeformis.AAC.2